MNIFIILCFIWLVPFIAFLMTRINSISDDLAELEMHMKKQKGINDKQKEMNDKLLDMLKRNVEDIETFLMR